MFCGKCGAQVRDGAPFCGKCGAAQTAADETGTASASDPAAEAEAAVSAPAIVPPGATSVLPTASAYEMLPPTGVAPPPPSGFAPPPSAAGFAPPPASPTAPFAPVAPVAAPGPGPGATGGDRGGIIALIAVGGVLLLAGLGVGGFFALRGLSARSGNTGSTSGQDQSAVAGDIFLREMQLDQDIVAASTRVNAAIGKKRPSTAVLQSELQDLVQRADALGEEVRACTDSRAVMLDQACGYLSIRAQALLDGYMAWYAGRSYQSYFQSGHDAKYDGLDYDENTGELLPDGLQSRINQAFAS